MAHNVLVRLAKLPDGHLTVDDFVVEAAPIPVPADGQVLTRTLWLSVDPYMRKRMQEAREGRNPLASGDVMFGRTVGVVEQSTVKGFRAGDLVLGWGGWRHYAVEDAATLELLDASLAPSLSLGVLGRPGITAWLGMMHVGRVQAGDTVVVTSAAGAVGSVAGAIARHHGARVVGIAGGRQKCERLVEDGGFHAAVDYTADDFEATLAQTTPHGVDLGFEAVGGRVLDAVLSRTNMDSRIALCGLVGQYESGEPHSYRNFGRILERSIRLEGFSINHLHDLHAQARANLGQWLSEGVLTPSETVTDGLENAPTALVNLLAGRGYGKHVVRVGDI